MKRMNQTTMRRLISIGMLLILVALFAVLAGTGEGKFFNETNLIEIVRNASIPAIIGVGVTYVIITAGIDLSTGSMLALVGMVMANIYVYTLLPIPIMIAAGLVVGLACGLANGIIVAKLNVPEFIGTLATMLIFRGLTYIIAVKNDIGAIESVRMNHSHYAFLGEDVFFVGLYYVIIAMIIIVAIGQIILKYTRFGTNLYSVGSSKKAATLSGIDVMKTRIMAYAITGVTVAIGAVFMTAKLQSTTANLGMDFEFDPIAAAVVGGVALSGGSGDVIGTLIGALFMATLDNGVKMLDMNASYQYVVKGTIIIAVVIFDALYKRRIDRRAKEEGAKEGLE